VRSVRVQGFVFDSLVGAPLAGATVTRESDRHGEPRLTFTDSAGRFALDSVPAGPGRFVFSHPALDSVGLADVPVPVDLSDARDGDEVRLATPSLGTITARACGASAITVAGTPARAVIVLGAVRGAVDARPAAGAAVRLAWLTDDALDEGAKAVGLGGDAGLAGGAARLAAARLALGVRREAVAETRTGDDGLYALCFRGPPEALAGLTLRAVHAAGAGDSLASGTVRVVAGARGLVRQNLLVAAAAPVRAAAGAPGAAVSGPTPSGAPPTPSAAAVPASAVARVEGTVRTGARAPVVAARVRVGDLDDADAPETLTDSQGRFRLASVRLGTQPLVVRALGFAVHEYVVDLSPRAPARADVVLTVATRLSPVEVRVERRTAWRTRLQAELAARRATGLGAFVDSTRLRHFGLVHQALDGVRGLRVSGGLVEPMTIRGPNGRAGVVLVDGVPDRAGVFVSGGLRADDIAAIEVYRTETGIPSPLLSSLPTGEFSLIAVWTKSHVVGPARAARAAPAAP
jgi:hypothetical protein